MKIVEVRLYKIDFPIYVDPYSNCIQNVFISLLKWKNIEYQKVYESNWSFFITGEKVFDIDIYGKDGFQRLFGSLEKNYGFKICLVNRPSLEDILQVIRKGEPIVAEVDTFYCSWHKTYCMDHRQHFLIIIGVDGKELLCVDSYSSKKVEKIRLENITCTLENILIIKKSDSVVSNWKLELERELVHMLSIENGPNTFMQIREFASRVKNRQEELIEEVLRYSSISYLPLLLKVNNISYGRRNFSCYLRYISKKNNLTEMDNFIRELEDVSVEWGKCCSLFIKYIKSDYSIELKERICTKINVIAIMEEDIARRLLEYARSGN